MRKPTGREYFFIVVLVAFAIGYLAYRDDGRLFGGGRDEQKKGSAFGIAPIIRIADLAAHTDDYDPKGRNLFEYYTPPPPKRAKPAAKPPAPQQDQPEKEHREGTAHQVLQGLLHSAGNLGHPRSRVNTERGNDRPFQAHLGRIRGQPRAQNRQIAPIGAAFQNIHRLYRT